MKEGTIIRRTCPFPLIIHTGITLVENDQILVCHNTGIKNNQFGGSIIIEPISDFLKLGRITSTKETDISTTQIKLFYEEKKLIRYSALTYNCEDFINELSRGKKGSIQRNIWSIGTVSLVLLKKVINRK